MRLAVIPARGGSKRIPRKNIKAFCGKPMIAWSIEAALKCQCFDRIVVSTDDQEVAKIAREYGAETPFVRPSGLADDQTPTIPVVAHAIQWQQQHGELPSEVCCIYATAPYVSSQDLIRGFELLQGTGCDYVFTVTSYAFPIQRAIHITQENRVKMFDPAFTNVRPQDLVEAYHDAGQFYWGRADAWLSAKPIFSSDTVPLVLPRYRVQDIDTVEDWQNAELKFLASQ